MTGSTQRVMLLPEVRRMIESARHERALLPPDAAEREFYLGVEAAADEVLHPELAQTRADGWLEARRAAFREGYLRAVTLLASAETSAEPPQRLVLPTPTRGG